MAHASVGQDTSSLLSHQTCPYRIHHSLIRRFRAVICDGRLLAGSGQLPSSVYHQLTFIVF